MTGTTTNAIATERASIVLVLDVEDLGATSAFWRDRLGFTVEREDPDARPFGACTLRHASVPGLAVQMKACGPRPSLGCSPGSLRRIALRVDNLSEAMNRVGDDVAWVETPEDADAPGARAIFDDPNGYRIELRDGRPAGSACSGATP